MKYKRKEYLRGGWKVEGCEIGKGGASPLEINHTLVFSVVFELFC